MKLLGKFNLLLVVVLGLGMTTAGFIAYRFLQQNAESQVEQQGRLMIAAALAMRSYTDKQIDPLLMWRAYHGDRFIAQTIPFYSATELFNYLRRTYPNYAYKEATLNPTNPRDRATDWQADVINMFRNDPGRDELVGHRKTPYGESLFIAHPIKAQAACLDCHGLPSRAPASIVRVYGRDNGYNWKDGEVIGAQIVSIPMSVPKAMAQRAFTTLVVALAAVFILTLILFDVGLVLTVIHPVRRLSSMADEISKGNLNFPELPAKGADEVSELARSFNRMYRSLVKALQMLDSHQG
jgi:HAMP domain-containing protein